MASVPCAGYRSPAPRFDAAASFRSARRPLRAPPAVPGPLGLDALVVSHPPNLRYLANHVGTAGLAVVTADAVHLLVDFRYVTAVEMLQASPGACPDLRVWNVPGSYDAALADCLASAGRSRGRLRGGARERGAARRLGARAARRGAAPSRSCRRIVMSRRDASSRMPRRWSGSAARRPGLTRGGGGGVRRGAAGRDRARGRRASSRRACVPAGTSVRRSTPSSRRGRTRPCRTTARASES